MALRPEASVGKLFKNEISGVAERFDLTHPGRPLNALRLKRLDKRFALTFRHSDQEPSARLRIIDDLFVPCGQVLFHFLEEFIFHDVSPRTDRGLKCTPLAATKLDQWVIGIFSFVPRAPGLLISRSYGRVMPARFA